MSGPPFSVDRDEVGRLYSPHFEIGELSRHDILAPETGCARGVTELFEACYYPSAIHFEGKSWLNPVIPGATWRPPWPVRRCHGSGHRARTHHRSPVRCAALGRPLHRRSQDFAGRLARHLS